MHDRSDCLSAIDLCHGVEWERDVVQDQINKNHAHQDLKHSHQCDSNCDMRSLSNGPIHRCESDCSISQYEEACQDDNCPDCRLDQIFDQNEKADQGSSCEDFSLDEESNELSDFTLLVNR